jgi:predicted  nucleic acid-binding Zn-ribbon protein
MKKDDFIPLIELQSLTNDLKKLEKEVQEELNRLDYLDNLNLRNEEKIELTKLKIDELTAISESKENNLAHLEKDLNKAKSDLMLSTSNVQLRRTEEKIETIKSNINQTEEEIILKLDEIEELERELNKLKTFKKNFPETYNELKSEIKSENKTIFNKISSKKERFQQLESELPDTLKNTFHQLSKKITPPISFIENNRCGACKTIQDNMTLQSINKYTDINFCQSCNRILIGQDILY